jgi:Uncharacterized protein conserved in archaea
MSLTFREMEEIVMRAFRLYHHPIAVTFLFTEDEVAQFKSATPHYVPVRPLTFCQWEIAARMKGQTIVGDRKTLGCPNGKISFGWGKVEKEEVDFFVKQYGSRELAEKMLLTKPKLPKNTLKGLAVGPLGKAVLPPHVVHFYCDNIQSHNLAVDYMVATRTHPLRPMVCENSSACGGAVFCWQEGTFNLTPSCPGSYSSGKTERGEVNVFIPGWHIEATVQRLVARSKERGDEADEFPGADICKNCPLIAFKREDEGDA